MKIVLAKIISFIQNIVREQLYCSEQFKRILRHPGNGTSEYGQSVDWRLPEGDKAAFGQIVFKGRDADWPGVASLFFLLAYHPRSVIARSVLDDGTTWKRNLSLKLSERVSHVRLTLQVLFFFFGQLSSFSFSRCSQPVPKAMLTRFAIRVYNTK